MARGWIPVEVRVFPDGIFLERLFESGMFLLYFSPILYSLLATLPSILFGWGECDELTFSPVDNCFLQFGRFEGSSLGTLPVGGMP